MKIALVAALAPVPMPQEVFELQLAVPSAPFVKQMKGDVFMEPVALT